MESAAEGAIWMVRSGRGSVHADLFREEGIVAIGFGELRDFPPDIGRDELKQLYADIHPQASPGKVAATAGQILRFLQEMEIGNRVTTYDGDRREYLLGTIASGPQPFDADSEDHTWFRRASWTGHLSRDSLSKTARNSLGAISTLFQLSDAASSEMIAKAVPLHVPLEDVPLGDASEAGDGQAEPIDAEVESPDSEEQILSKADEKIEDRLVRLDWEEMQELVAGILRAMGYKTEVASGADRGVDVFASPDGLGLEEPRIFVEVKHRPGTTMGSQSLRSFLGGRQSGDRCLYVSTGGFTKDAQYEADRSNVPLTLIGLPELRELLVEHYEALDLETKQLVPLTRLYWPAVGD